MHWKDYETTVKHIYETLGKEHGVKIICYGRKCKCTGKNSGVPHQLDVLYSTTDGINIYKSYVECKYRNEKINKDHIMKVEAIIKDCHLNKGIIVSKLGFKDQAINYAKSVNIELQILRKPTEKDKQDRLWKLMLRPSLVTSVYINVDIITEDGMDPTNVEQARIILPDESEFDLETLIKGFSKGKHEINCPKNTLLVSNDIKTKIKSIIIEVTHKTKKLGTTRLNADDKIKMIMEDVDKKKNIILTTNGDVEDKS